MHQNSDLNELTPTQRQAANSSDVVAIKLNNVPSKGSVGFEMEHAVAVETRHEKSPERREGEVFGSAQRRVLCPDAQVGASDGIKARNSMCHKVCHVEQSVGAECDALGAIQGGGISECAMEARRGGVEHQDLVRPKTGDID